MTTRWWRPGRGGWLNPLIPGLHHERSPFDPLHLFAFAQLQPHLAADKPWLAARRRTSGAMRSRCVLVSHSMSAIGVCSQVSKAMIVPLQPLMRYPS